MTPRPFPRLLAGLLAALPLAFAGTVAGAAPRQEARLADATEVLEATARMRDQAIPDWLLQRAHGVAIVPGVVRVGLGIGGRGGRGVLLVRRPDGRWSNPAFVTIAGGSIGWQAGIQESDIVLVFTTRRSVEGLSGGKFTLGADASVAVGPLGRQVSGATDVTLDAEVYSYSQSRGLFGGLAIDGTVLSIDHRSNAEYYGRRDVLPSEVFAADAPSPPPSARRLQDALTALTGTGARPASAVAGGAPASGSPAGPSAAASDAGPGARDGAGTAAPVERGLESGGAATFPLESAPPPK